MLTDDEKNHIRLEEVFRHEVQQELLKKEEVTLWRGKIWAFINSAIFLWFLSTVVIGTASLIYTTQQKKSEEQRRQHEQDLLVQRENFITARKLDTEISSRLSYFNLMAIDFDYAKLRKALLALNRPLEADYPINIFPEYSARSFQSLLFELLQVAPGNEKIEIRKAYEATNYHLFYSLDSLKKYSLPEFLKSLSKTQLTSAEKQKMYEYQYLELLSNLKVGDLNLPRWNFPIGLADSIANRDSR
jgi:hypothetical protein